jgi:hypothetical protein
MRTSFSLSTSNLSISSNAMTLLTRVRVSGRRTLTEEGADGKLESIFLSGVLSVNKGVHRETYAMTPRSSRRLYCTKVSSILWCSSAPAFGAPHLRPGR